MSNVYEVRHRVLEERSNQIVAKAKRAPHDECVRLALLCLALFERHTVNDKGRCGIAEHRVNGGEDDRANARYYRS
ncbi:MAG: hypothetical protein ACRDTJ_26065 [Pseudonocardiaceae bacterium]